MAGPTTVPSHDTALCIVVPDQSQRDTINRLRRLYDQRYEAWPAHINLIYPFVSRNHLTSTTQKLASHVKQKQKELPSIRVRLDTPGVFTPRGNGKTNTIYISEKNGDNQHQQQLRWLRTLLLEALGRGGGEGAQDQENQLHMTIGQSDDVDGAPHKFLLEKARLLPPIEWEVKELCILVRERSDGNGTEEKPSSGMKLWGTIDLSTFEISCSPSSSSLLLPEEPTVKCDTDDMTTTAGSEDGSTLPPLPRKPLIFSDAEYRWKECSPDILLPPRNGDGEKDEKKGRNPETLIVASYNVLAEFHWPPSEIRYPLILNNLLSREGFADVLVLQEVTDSFLSYLLSAECRGGGGHSQKMLRERYPFVSRGPPCQPDLEPLPSHLNVVILSRYAFTWDWLPLRESKRHKGTAIVQFVDIGTLTTTNNDNGSEGKHDSSYFFLPAILATVHLTCGLTNTAASAKKQELQTLLSQLTQKFSSPERRKSNPPCILAGDFNVTTSAHTLESAVRQRVVSAFVPGMLRDMTTCMLANAGFVDAWTAAKVRYGCGGGGEGEDSSSFEGEEGATFDPTVNELAAKVVAGSEHEFLCRPQRYDRIMVRRGGLFEVAGFNVFGRNKGVLLGGEGVEGEQTSFASDHWGVRCLLKLNNDDDDENSTTADHQHSDENKLIVVPVHLKVAAPESPLSQVSDLRDYLEKAGEFPSEEDIKEREAALRLLTDVLLDNNNNNNNNNKHDNTPTAAAATRGAGQPSFVVTPVGSYGMGTWNPSSSDMDVLCIGPISSRIFFSLATQRIRRNSSSVHIVRRVNAHSGTMLELSIGGGRRRCIKVDLQYCPSAQISTTWPLALLQPQGDFDFDFFTAGLPTQTLAKLKPLRDMHYLLRTLPDRTTFRLAYRVIRLWARTRGIYAARLGYLGGVQISVLLARVCKLLPQAPVPDLLVSFFAHYARDFDWAGDLAFDPFFFFSSPPVFGRRRGKKSTRRYCYYVRTTREPMALLGWHPPSLNTAHAASVHSVGTVAREFERADRLLSPSSSSETITWARFLGGGGEKGDDSDNNDNNIMSSAAGEFLGAYKSYVKIDVHFWGVPVSKGSSFVGWLESRCVMLLVDLNRRLPNIHARMWPARFVDADGASEQQEENGQRDYQGYYLVGLEKWEGHVPKTQPTLTKHDMKVAYGSLQGVLQKFEAQIRGDEKYFDAKSCWMSAAVANRADVSNLRVDQRDWGEYTIGEDESEDEEEEEEEEDYEEKDGDQTLLSGDEATDGGAGAGVGSGKARSKRSTTAAKDTARPAYTGKFRSSADVMNRLRWDPDMDSGDFVVGYEDRFLGPKERALDLWKSEQTDEEFIPQHRIHYFKRKSDGVIVWDRHRRKDEIFMSGVSSMGSNML